MTYILNIDSELNFEKEKPLKNKIANTLNKDNYEISELKNISVDEMKEKYEYTMKKIDDKKVLKTNKKKKKKKIYISPNSKYYYLY